MSCVSSILVLLSVVCFVSNSFDFIIFEFRLFSSSFRLLEQVRGHSSGYSSLQPSRREGVLKSTSPHDHQTLLVTSLLMGEDNQQKSKVEVKVRECVCGSMVRVSM